MATEKYVYFIIASAPNGVDTLVNSGNGLTSLGDDFVDRTLTGIYVANNTALLQAFVRSKTKKIAILPCASFSATYNLIPLNYRYPKTILFDVGVTNSTGGTITNIEGFLKYEITGEQDQLI